jgi:transmembrane sensor
MTAASRRGSARSAAEWFAIMRGPNAEAERVAFETWRASRANADAYARLEATWEESRFLANSRVGQGRDLSRARRTMPPAALLAAGVALLTLLSGGLVADHMGWFDPAAMRPPAAVRIAAGEIGGEDTVRTVRLPDGSRVTLDRGAALRDLSTPGERRFVLLRGRARFDVAHDSARAFLVDAGQGRVVAHGTLFDVGIEDGTVRVALIKGSVEVQGRTATKRDGSGSRFLAPGEQLVVAGGQVGAPSRANAILLSWPDAMISFDDMPLAEAVARFNGAGGAKVRLDGTEHATRRVSGAFRRDDPRGFADALAASFGLEVEAAPDGSLVLRASTGGVR